MWISSQARIAELEAALFRSERDAARREAELKQRLILAYESVLGQVPVGSPSR
jgi:hypothetical protein